MKTLGTVKIHLLSEALSPITHMGGTSGNEGVLNREKVVFNGDVVEVPFLSGNALRHRMIREPGATYLVEACGLKGHLNIDQANFLFTGGSLCESSTSDNLKVIAKMQEVSPFCRLVGGSLKSQIISGSLFVSRGLLVCDENLDCISKHCAVFSDVATAHAHLAQSYISKTQYTRGDASRMRDAGEIVKDQIEATKSNLMIYGGEAVVPGSMFYHSLILNNVCPLEVGAALHSYMLWQHAGGIIGGSARIGHGRLSSTIHIEGLESFDEGSPLDAGALVVEYMEHVNSHTEEFTTWLNEAFK